MQDYLFIKEDKNFFKLTLSEILFIESEKKYVKIVTAKSMHLVLTSISAIEKVLPRTMFCRIHRSYIVSMEHTTRFNCDFVYIGTKKLPISEQYKNILKRSVIILASHMNTLKLDDDVDKLLDNFS